MTGEHQKNDWFAVGAYALLAATSQMLWLTYAPITTESAAHFGVSEDAVGWLAEIFPLLYVVLAIPAALLLDRWLRQTLMAASALMLGGAAVRMVGGGFSAALAGQVLVAIAQPAVLAAVTKVAAERVRPDARTTAISIGSAGLFVGIVLSLLLGATLGASNGLRPLLAVNLGVAALACLLTWIALREPAAREAEESVAVAVSDLRGIYTDPVLSRLGVMTFIGMGVFNGLATWLEVLLRPAGISSSTAGSMLVVLTLAGVVGAVLIPPRVAGRGAEAGYLQLAGAIGAMCFLLLAATDVVPVAFCALGALGFFLLAAQPVILELSERRAGAATAASAAGAILLAGNLGGIVLAVLVQTVNGHPTAAFLLLAIAMSAILPVARSLARTLSAQAA